MGGHEHGIRNLRPRHDPDSVLIAKYTPLVCKEVRRFGFYQKGHDHNGMEVEDAIQAGLIGLWLASKNYDPAKACKWGDPFVAYASTRIRFEISNEMNRCQVTRGEKHHGRVRLESWDFWREPSDMNVEEQVANCEWLERIDAAVERMDLKRRTVFHGVMKHDDAWSNSRIGEQCHEALNISPSRVSHLRKDIRKKLRSLH